MELKILSANIAFGLPRMDSLMRNFAAHFGIHGWRIVPLSLAGNMTNFLFDLSQSRYPERSNYIRDKSDLSRIVHVVHEQQPDVVILNELLFRVHKHEIELWLRDEGFHYFSWGRSAYHLSDLDHRDMTTATLVASKTPVLEGYVPFMPQLAQPGGGGGIAGVRLSNAPITIIGLHLAIFYKKLWRSQIERIVELVLNERDQGREVILAGDWNATSRAIIKTNGFSDLGLETADASHTPTCPTAQMFGFPRRRHIDHIFIPQKSRLSAFNSGHFGSDHMWVSATIDV